MPSATFVSVEESYRLCEDLSRGSNFYYGFRFLPARKHRALSAIYAFMRHCDDISDGPEAVPEKKENFRQWRNSFEQAMQEDHFTHPSLPALKDAIRAYDIPVLLFHQLIEGTEMDLTTTRYDTFAELYRYCYHVASVVGLVCLHLFNFREKRAMDYAEACGIAFQLTNILRDIKEDLQNDRVYLPQEDLRRFNYSERDLTNETMDERFIALMKFQSDRARVYYEKARPLVGMIERDSRPAFWTMYLSYEKILHRMEQQGYPVFHERVKLRKPEKLGIIFRALAKAVS